MEVSKETLASKFRVHTNTIKRWTSGESSMTYAEEKMLRDIYRREIRKRGLEDK